MAKAVPFREHARFLPIQRRPSSPSSSSSSGFFRSVSLVPIRNNLPDCPHRRRIRRRSKPLPTRFQHLHHQGGSETRKPRKEDERLSSSLRVRFGIGSFAQQNL